jgi:hypothetical protein
MAVYINASVEFTISEKLSTFLGTFVLDSV